VGRYSVTHNKAGVNTANTMMWQLRAVSTQRMELLELMISVRTAPTTGPSWRLNRGTALGTSSATKTPQAEDPDDVAAAAVLDTAWSVNPTAAADDLREFGHPNSIGSAIVWTWWNKPLRINKSTGLIIINANASGTTAGLLVVTAVFDE